MCLLDLSSDELGSLIMTAPLLAAPATSCIQLQYTNYSKNNQFISDLKQNIINDKSIRLKIKLI